MDFMILPSTVTVGVLDHIGVTHGMILGLIVTEVGTILGTLGVGMIRGIMDMAGAAIMVGGTHTIMVAFMIGAIQDMVVAI